MWLTKVNKAHIAGMMEAIEEYLRLLSGVMRVPLEYVIRKTIIVRPMVITLSMTHTHR